MAGSEVKTSWSVEVFVADPSVTVRVTPKLPLTVGVPDMRPVTGSALNPAGRPVALKRAFVLAPLVNTSKLKNCPFRAVIVVPLAIVNPGLDAGCTVSVNVRMPVPNEFDAVS